MSKLSFTRREMLAVASARCINDGDVVFIGVGSSFSSELSSFSAFSR